MHMKVFRNKNKLLSILVVLAMSITMLGINLPFSYAGDIQAAFTAPASRQMFSPGSTVEISGTAQGVAEVTVMVRNEQDSLVFTAQPEVNDGVFSTSFTLAADAAEGEYSVFLSGLNLPTVKERIFIVNNTKVAVNLTKPSAGTKFEAGDVVEIAGTAENADYLYISVRNSENGRVYVAQPAVKNDSFTCGFTLPADAAAGEYSISVNGYGMTDALTSSFTVQSSGSGSDDGSTTKNALTIKGNGVAHTVNYTLDALKQFEMTRAVLSVTSDRPENLEMAVEGISLKTLLDNAGINWDKAKLIKFVGTDGYTAEFTVDELFNQSRYIFPAKRKVEPMIALSRAERSSDYADLSNADSPVLVYGQRAATEQTLLWFVKRLASIDVSTNTPTAWDEPTALIVTPGTSTKVPTLGGNVPSGSLVYLKHGSAIPKIYYTVDGSNPNMDSKIFNLHGCGPEQGVEEPIKITGGTTIKAVAIGRGKCNSNAMSLTFTVPGSGNDYVSPSVPKAPEAINSASQLLSQVISESNLVREPVRLENGLQGERITLREDTLGEIENVVPKSRLTVIAGNDVDAVQSQIPGSILQKALEKELYIGIDSQMGSYTLPTDTLNLEEDAARLGVNLDALSLNIVISKGGAAAKNKMSQQLQAGQQMQAEPVEFKVEVVAPGGKKIEYSDFGGRYVERDLVLNSAVDPRQVVGVVWDEATGKFRPLPTLFEERDGKTYSVIFSRSNSLYTALQSNKTFSDIKGNWAKGDIELLSSKLLISGKTATLYDPKSSITRAEFSALLVRALGLKEGVLKEGQFKDVNSKAWYAGSVAAAVAENIITGYEGRLFKPNDNISREEMAVMIIRAARVAGVEKSLLAVEQEQYLAKFKDRQAVSSWAANSVAEAARVGIIGGMPNGKFSPRNNADRAQSAAILKRFLSYVNFIDAE